SRGVTLSLGGLSAAVTPSLLAGAVHAASVGALAGPVSVLAEGGWRSMMADTMRRFVAAWAAGALVALGAGAGGFWGRAGEPGVPAQPIQPAVQVVVQQPPATGPQERTEDPRTFRTRNFQVTAPTRRLAQVLAEAAERERSEQAVRWLGKELPDWPEP